MKPVSLTLALFVLLLGVSRSSSAQTPQGAIEGQVTDASGGVMAGANVTVTGPNGAARTATTDTQGRYRVDGLAPAAYTVKILNRGFAPFDSASIGVAGQVQILNARLQIQAERANVTVTDTTSQVDESFAKRRSNRSQRRRSGCVFGRSGGSCE